MEVREATPADAGAILDVHTASIVELGRDAYDDAQVAAWAEVGAPEDYDIGAPDRYYVVAEDGGAVLGFGSLSFAPSDDLTVDVDAEVTAVYVHPSAARQGIGSAILARLERAARTRGMGALGLWASRNAVAFYEATGYERVAERTHAFSEGVQGTVVEMRKEP